jgi:hypothetical protein
MTGKQGSSPESIVREIKRQTRRKFTAEEKIRIVLEGLRGEAGITDLCRKDIRLAELGLDPARAYVFDEPWIRCADGKLVVKAALGPWGAKMASAEGR